MTTKLLAGKSALVTGGAQRIGKAIALKLAQAGADVAITYRSSKAEAEETAAAIAACGVRGLALRCDVRSETAVRDTVAEVANGFGGIDVVVNNAGIFETAALDTLATEHWNAVFETNTRGPFLVARESLPHLRQSEGRIVNLGSLGGDRAWAGHGHYCASKAAVHMLTQTMAKAFAPEVSVNCVAPGWIETGKESAEVAARFAARTPMRRNGTPDEVAEAVLFFATGPHFLTGQVLVVDGGLGL